MSDTSFQKINGRLHFDGFLSRGMDFIEQHQLLDRQLWKSFVNVFRTKEDSLDLRWRCEYWGKMMRGGCICYSYNKDEKLYSVLEEAVEDMLSTQDEYGRFSTYTIDKEFQSWDMWGRKYVLTGLLHFYDICQKPALKTKVLDAAKRHVDYIIEKVGGGPNQIKITETSNWWLGINSSSILEPIVALYNITKIEKYLSFAAYIVKEGGIKGGNLISLAEEDKLLPYQYPENKAYETMSFFEGVLEYSLAANDRHLYEIALRFFERVYESEISITGNAGSVDELFSHASINQIVKPQNFCQETCVSVTWMRIMHKLYLLTGEYKYHERFITTGLNSYFGSINFDHQPCNDYQVKKLKALPFDSYSPLVFDRRGVATGGLNYMQDGSYYGCCTCIGSAGIGLIGQDVILEKDGKVCINDLFEGVAETTDYRITIKGDFLRDDFVSVDIDSTKDIVFRNPTHGDLEFVFDDKTIVVNDDHLDLKKGRYHLEIKHNIKVEKEVIGDMSAFKYGYIVLAIDEESNPNIDITKLTANKIHSFKKLDDEKSQFISFSAKFEDTDIIFKDYASCGKKWDSPNNLLTVFFKNCL